MFCEKCGSELQDDWKICPNCGEPVPEEKEENITEQSREVPTDNKTESTEHFGDSTTQSTYVSDNKKNSKGIIIGVVVALIVIGVAVFFLFGKKDKKVDAPKEDKKTETEVSDFSKQDFEELVGKTVEDVKKTGLVEMDNSGEFEGLSGSITVRVEDGQVNYIAITGDKTKSPTFHGVSLGMTEEEANSKLADTYSQATNQTDNMRVYNSDKKATVYLGFTDGKVDSITYRPMEDTEVQNNQVQEYIFPDSDKKYLSEDEVRSVDASLLSLGRNEIFARHGYIFKDDSINQYFKGKSWYQGTVPADQFDIDAVFNDFEKKNVELIKKVENEGNGTSSKSFIGIEGTYQSGSDDDSGVIGVTLYDGDIYFTIGTQSNPGILGGIGGSIKGTIENSNTVTIDYGAGLIFKMVWKDKGVFVITRTTPSGWDEIDDVTDNVEYVNAEYYGVS